MLLYPLHRPPKRRHRTTTFFRHSLHLSNHIIWAYIVHISQNTQVRLERKALTPDTPDGEPGVYQSIAVARPIYRHHRCRLRHQSVCEMRVDSKRQTRTLNRSPNPPAPFYPLPKPPAHHTLPPLSSLCAATPPTAAAFLLSISLSRSSPSLTVSSNTNRSLSNTSAQF